MQNSFTSSDSPDPVFIRTEHVYVGPKISYEELGNLIGRLLTLNDAFEQDPERRAAKKTLIKQTCKDWLEDQAADQQVKGWGETIR